METVIDVLLRVNVAGCDVW